MAIDRFGRLDVTTTVGGAWGDIWRVLKPGVPLVLGMLVGFVPFFFVLTSIRPSPETPISSGTVVALIGCFLFMILFSSFIYMLMMRLFMLGRAQFLHVSLATLMVYFLRCLWKGIQLFILLLPVNVLFFGPIVGVIAYGFHARSVGSPLAVSSAVGLTLGGFFWALAGIVVTVVISVRVFPVFYSIVVGGNLGFRESWRGMSGYTWRSFLSFLLVWLGSLAISMGVSILAAIVLGILGAVSAVGGLLPSPQAAGVGIAAANMLLMLPVYYINFTWTAATKARIFKDIWPPHDEGIPLPEASALEH